MPVMMELFMAGMLMGTPVMAEVTAVGAISMYCTVGSLCGWVGEAIVTEKV